MVFNLKTDNRLLGPHWNWPKKFSYSDSLAILENLNFIDQQVISV